MSDLIIGCKIHDTADVTACCPAIDSPGAHAYRGLLVKALAEIARLTAEREKLAREVNANRQDIEVDRHALADAQLEIARLTAEAEGKARSNALRDAFGASPHESLGHAVMRATAATPPQTVGGPTAPVPVVSDVEIMRPWLCMASSPGLAATPEEHQRGPIVTLSYGAQVRGEPGLIEVMTPARARRLAAYIVAACDLAEPSKSPPPARGDRSVSDHREEELTMPPTTDLRAALREAAHTITEYASGPRVLADVERYRALADVPSPDVNATDQIRAEQRCAKQALEERDQARAAMVKLALDVAALSPLKERLRYTQRNTKPDIIVKAIDDLLAALDAIATGTSHGEAFLRRVLIYTKHGPRGKDDAGPCDAQCVKCEAERLINLLPKETP